MRKKEIEQILDEYFKQQGLTHQTNRKIQDWLLSKEESEEIDRILYEKFDRKPVVNRKDGELMQDLEALHTRLGFPADSKPSRILPFYKRMVFRVAAVVIPVMILAGTAFWLMNRDTVETPGRQFVAQNTITVMDGEQDYLTLPDGSKVWINGQSELSYSRDFEQNREIMLKGEAWFSVIHTENHAPFTIRTQALTVTVLGTEFNVRDYGSEATAQVTLKRGSVEVQTANHQTVRLEPDVQAVVDRITAAIYTQKVDSGSIGWTSAGKEFNNAPLEDVFRYLGARYKVVFVIEDSLAFNKHNIRIRFKGNETLDDALYALRFVTDNTFGCRVEDDTIYITAPGQ